MSLSLSSRCSSAASCSRPACSPLFHPSVVRPLVAAGSRCLPLRQQRAAERPSLARAAATSADPLSSRTVYEAGHTFSIHSEEELDSFLAKYHDKLVVLMTKASHCKPCKAFMKTYHLLAERFGDAVLLDITGDETQATRQTMMKWKIKVTPTFRLYRGGELVATVTGVANSSLLKAMLENLKDGERGRDWAPAEDSDDESDDE